MNTRQGSPARPRLTPRHELVNTLEFEAEAARVLPADVLRGIAGSDHSGDGPGQSEAQNALAAEGEGVCA